MLSQRPDAVVATLRAAGCVFAEEEAELLLAAASSDDELTALVKRRVAGDPLEQILGWVEFCGLRVTVAPKVFVPRRRTELMVRQAAALGRTGAVVVDLCCGSGAVGLALSTLIGPIELYAADIDPAAVSCARGNLLSVGGQVFQGDLYAALPNALQGRVDILLANAPYVPTTAMAFMPAEARVHEPPAALDGGPDGLDTLRRVIADATCWLAPGGSLLVETSADQAATTTDIARGHDLSARTVTSTELDGTAIIATRS